MVCAASAAGASEVVSETIFPSRTPTSQLPTASGPTTRPPRTNRSSTYILTSAASASVQVRLVQTGAGLPRVGLLAAPARDPSPAGCRGRAASPGGTGAP